MLGRLRCWVLGVGCWGPWAQRRGFAGNPLGQDPQTQDPFFGGFGGRGRSAEASRGTLRPRPNTQHPRPVLRSAIIENHAGGPLRVQAQPVQQPLPAAGAFPPDGEGRRVLDLGCANGYLGALLAARGYRVTGVERRGRARAGFPARSRTGRGRPRSRTARRSLRATTTSSAPTCSSTCAIPAGCSLRLARAARARRPAGRLAPQQRPPLLPPERPRGPLPAARPRPVRPHPPALLHLGGWVRPVRRAPASRSRTCAPAASPSGWRCRAGRHTLPVRAAGTPFLRIRRALWKTHVRLSVRRDRPAGGEPVTLQSPKSWWSCRPTTPPRRCT